MMPLLLLSLLAALIQVGGQPLAGGKVSGAALVPLERAVGGDTPVLTLVSPRGPIRLLLDTGASSTMVTPALLSRLALQSSPLPPKAFALAGGGRGCQGLQPRRTLLPPLELGAAAGDERLRLVGVEALVLPAGALPPGVDGVLGAPTLRHQPLWIDPLGGRVAIGAAALREASGFGPDPGGHRAVGQSLGTVPADAGPPGEPAPALRLPLRWRQGVPLLELRTPLGSVPALADTGAEGLFLSQGLAARLPDRRSGLPLTLVGFCGAQQVEQRPIAGLSLAAVTSNRPATTASKATHDAIILANPIFQVLGVEAIVGQELLRHRRQLWRLDLQDPRLELR